MFNTIGFVVDQDTNLGNLIQGAIAVVKDIANARLLVLVLRNESPALKRSLEAQIGACGLDASQFQVYWRTNFWRSMLNDAVRREKIDLLVTEGVDQSTVDEVLKVHKLFSVLYAGAELRWRARLNNLLANHLCSILFVPTTSPASREEGAIILVGNDPVHARFGLNTVLDALVHSPKAPIVLAAEVYVPGLRRTLMDYYSEQEHETIKHDLLAGKNAELVAIVKEYAAQNLNLEAKALFGVSEKGIYGLAQDRNANLMVTFPPSFENDITTELFPHDYQLILQELSCYLLILSPNLNREDANG